MAATATWTDGLSFKKLAARADHLAVACTYVRDQGSGGLPLSFSPLYETSGVLGIRFTKSVISSSHLYWGPILDRLNAVACNHPSKLQNGLHSPVEPCHLVPQLPATVIPTARSFHASFLEGRSTEHPTRHTACRSMLDMLIVFVNLTINPNL